MFATMHATDADVRLCDSPGMFVSKTAWQVYELPF